MKKRLMMMGMVALVGLSGCKGLDSLLGLSDADDNTTQPSRAAQTITGTLPDGNRVSLPVSAATIDTVEVAPRANPSDFSPASYIVYPGIVVKVHSGAEGDSYRITFSYRN